MGRRRIDQRRIKTHFAYTVEEVASTLGVHKNTVRAWIKSGLQVSDNRRPVVMSGAEVRRHLTSRSAARKRKLAPGQFYCFRCRDAVHPFAGIADLVPVCDTIGTLHGLCPNCGTLLNRRVSLARWTAAAAGLEVVVKPGPAMPSLDRDPHPKP